MSSEKRADQFLFEQGQVVVDYGQEDKGVDVHASGNTFYPPVPLQSKPGEALTGTGLVLEMIPALARITVELDRNDQRRVTFQPGCPARLVLEKLVGQVILRANTKADQARLVWLARLVRHALEVADELHQMDGSPALCFAAGFVAGESAGADLFGGQEVEARALDNALEKAAHGGLGGTPFRLGFQTRRDQLRQARMSSLEGI